MTEPTKEEMREAEKIVSKELGWRIEPQQMMVGTIEEYTRWNKRILNSDKCWIATEEELTAWRFAILTQALLTRREKEIEEMKEKLSTALAYVDGNDKDREIEELQERIKELCKSLEQIIAPQEVGGGLTQFICDKDAFAASIRERAAKKLESLGLHYSAEVVRNLSLDEKEE